MGTFTYDATLKADFDDRVLAHLQLVITAKLRRGESFIFSWKDDASIGGGRTMIWVHPAVSLAYKFSGSKMPAINRHWIEVLVVTANQPAGLQVVPEPDLGTGA